MVSRVTTVLTPGRRSSSVSRPAIQASPPLRLVIPDELLNLAAPPQPRNAVDGSGNSPAARVNTGRNAAAENAPRGNFFKGKKLDGTETGDHDNWEQTKIHRQSLDSVLRSARWRLCGSE